MNQKLKGFSKLAVVSLIFSLLFVAGCSDNYSVNPEPSQSPTLSARAIPSLPPQEVDAIISNNSEIISVDDGGVITIDRDKYEHSFSVEPRAVVVDVEINVVSYEEKVRGNRAIIFEFCPSGLVFNSPAKLEFDMSELDSKADYAKLFYYHPAYKIWVLQSIKKVESKRVEFDINHFSRYAISD